jgi:hypothetical protein
MAASVTYKSPVSSRRRSNYNFNYIDLVTIPSIDLSAYSSHRDLYNYELNKVLNGIENTEPYYKTVLIASKVQNGKVVEWMVYNNTDENKWEFSQVVMVNGKFKPIHFLTRTIRSRSRAVH